MRASTKLKKLSLKIAFSRKVVQRYLSFRLESWTTHLTSLTMTKCEGKPRFGTQFNQRRKKKLFRDSLLPTHYRSVKDSKLKYLWTFEECFVLNKYVSALHSFRQHISVVMTRGFGNIFNRECKRTKVGRCVKRKFWKRSARGKNVSQKWNTLLLTKTTLLHTRSSEFILQHSFVCIHHIHASALAFVDSLQ